MANELEVVLAFNPETKKLEKVIKEFDNKTKNVKYTIAKPDLKPIEGPLKDLQEKFATVSAGGLKTGLNQITKAFQEFRSIRESGGGLVDSITGGLSRIGPEGAIALEGLAVAASAAAAAVPDERPRIPSRPGRLAR